MSEIQDDEERIQIGDFEVPKWQFDIYVIESEKFVQSLEDELRGIADGGVVSKTLIRAIHTLSGTTNTLGIDHVAKVSQPVEGWLTQWMDLHEGEPLTHHDMQQLLAAGKGIVTMVRAIQTHAMPDPEPYAEQQKYFLERFTEEQKESSENKATSTEFQELLSLEKEEGPDFSELASLLGDLTPPEVDIPVGDVSIAAAQPVAQTYHRQVDLTPVLISMLPNEHVLDQIDHSIKDVFLDEATDIFGVFPQAIEKWMVSNAEDVEQEGLIKRYLHTLKGSARMAGYQRFGRFVHNLETAIDDGWVGIQRFDLPELMQTAADTMAQEVEHYKNSISPSGFANLVYRHGRTPTTTTSASMTSLLQGMPAADLSVSTPTPVTASVVSPKTDAVQARKSALQRNDLPLGFKQRINLEQRKGQSQEDEEAGLGSVLRVPATKIETLSHQLGRNGMLQLKIDAGVQSVEEQMRAIDSNLERLGKLLKEVEIQAEIQIRSRMQEAKKEGHTFDPLEFDRFTRLQELTRMTAEAMGDITNSHAEMVKGFVSVQDAVAETAIVSDDMQHAVISVRTVPVSSIRPRLDRIVRMAARDTDKLVHMVFENELDVDGGVLQKVTVPIEHLVRNAIAHGIEAPAIRERTGKARTGKVALRTVLRGNDIVFQLSDDGGGILREVVEQKAKEKNLIGPNDTITQEQANMLIFDPGFSTADQISALAGRGVGMDVVQAELANMGGRIHVHSEPGAGTTFELIVPSYMSVMSMVPVRAKNVLYAIPATLVEDVVVWRDTQILDSYDKGYVLHNGARYAFYGLNEVQGLGRNDIVRNNRVVLSVENDVRVAMHIDALETDRNLVMRPLCRTIAALPGLMGSTVAGDGTPMLVINPVHLRHSLQRDENDKRVVQGPITTRLPDAKRQRSDITVMVVDDSLTVRRVTQRFLEREGFHCVVAIDGLDAIEKIGTHGTPDIFLCDIEMPNMDGFQLVEHIRTVVSKTVPIIMISSRSIEKYAAHARSIRVNMSLGKPYQEPELLAAIERLTHLVES